ncbi:helix-turn-helix transcriptional regulator [Nocardia otitidiscaviarum]|uniref:helix-turn-helix domain-containing protein n=1 Tax=Nocardia otitidiscaviarum TaxID=1823 RepID=UPI0018954084|nr:helix-turn-helix transcriptional regulator [Nocardia otitidiscaviarum]MBF6133484.1 helix-turn-helix transcriptional regulator [Nocardia otitidiscaviarum]
MDAEESARTRVGRYVERKRLDMGYGQLEFSQKAGVDPKTVRGLERGLRWPRVSSMAKIEATLDLQMGTLEAMRRKMIRRSQLTDAAGASSHDRKHAQAAQGAQTAPRLEPVPPVAESRYEGSSHAIRPVSHDLMLQFIMSMVRFDIAADEAKAGNRSLEELLRAAEPLRHVGQLMMADWFGGPEGLEEFGNSVMFAAKRMRDDGVEDHSDQAADARALPLSGVKFYRPTENGREEFRIPGWHSDEELAAFEPDDGDVDKGQSPDWDNIP